MGSDLRADGCVKSWKVVMLASSCHEWMGAIKWKIFVLINHVKDLILRDNRCRSKYCRWCPVNSVNSNSKKEGKTRQRWDQREDNQWSLQRWAPAVLLKQDKSTLENTEEAPERVKHLNVPAAEEWSSPEVWGQLEEDPSPCAPCLGRTKARELWLTQYLPSCQVYSLEHRVQLMRLGELWDHSCLYPTSLESAHIYSCVL